MQIDKAKKGANEGKRENERRDVFRKKGRKQDADVPDHVDKMSKPPCTDWPSRGQDTTGLGGTTISKFSSKKRENNKPRLPQNNNGDFLQNHKMF